ncbi:MAG: hypothetical protein KAI42_03295 [Dehalococcoidales bacterium]|nr:hypothetical protein [Dehalococcoidales bacterium]
MKGKLIWSIFWALVGVFVIVVSTIFIPPAVILLMPLGLLPAIFLAAIVVFVLLSVALLFLTVKTKVGGILKKFLLLTGASAVGLPVFVLLHNVVSGLFNIEEPVFFIMATLVCPIGFLVGAVGSVVLAIKNKQVKYSS